MRSSDVIAYPLAPRAFICYCVQAMGLCNVRPIQKSRVLRVESQIAVDAILEK